MNGYFLYPNSTIRSRIIPKIKFYEKAKINNRLKEDFVKEIEKIVWQHTLSKDTINIDSTEKVKEIQVFDIHSKGNDISDNILRIIDNSIPYPIIFQIIKDNNVKIKAAYKKKDLNITKTIILQYLETPWFNTKEDKKPLPIALNLSKLYEAILNDLFPANINTSYNASIEEKIQRFFELANLNKKYEQLKTKRDKEKQFNKRVEINNELKKIQSEIQRRIK